MAMIGLVLLFSVVAAISVQSCIVLTFAYLAVQGDVRRLISVGMGPGSDPLVLVAPCIVLLLTVVAILRNRLTRKTVLARQLIIVLVIMGIQSLNPRQGSLMAGVMGILCVMVPMCWFWVGQSWGSSRFLEFVLYRGVIPIAVGVAVFGLTQVFIGRPEYQQAWVRTLYAGRSLPVDAMRPFGTFTSLSEFTKYLSVGVVALVASVAAGRPRLLLLGLPVLAVALFMSGANGPIVYCSGVIVCLWALRGRGGLGSTWRGVLAALLLMAGLLWTLNEVHEMEVAPELQYTVKRQTNGLLNPFDARRSTAVGHAAAAASGIIEGVVDPVGKGLGVVTHVSTSYGGAGAAAREVDIANMFIALGTIGGIAYALMIFKSFRVALRYWQTVRQPIAMTILAILLVLVGNWMNTGEYSTISLAWFCVGCLDRQSNQLLNPSRSISEAKA
jgi:hypothetical protein